MESQSVEPGGIYITRGFVDSELWGVPTDGTVSGEQLSEFLHRETVTPFDVDGEFHWPQDVDGLLYPFV
ncbi:hypothetical protein [Halobaculum sp. D14]|uniref:hypothetical protein n=1 Tax=unclassified Halobaculum TaxID=2640896 RepID=UPI003EB7EB29